MEARSIAQARNGRVAPPERVSPASRSGLRSRICSNFGGRRLILLELVIGYGLILLVLWTLNPVQARLFWAAIAWILLATVRAAEGGRALGLRLAGFTRSLWIVGCALLLAGVAVLAAARLHTLHCPHSVRAFAARFWGYSVWALLQQFILQDFVLLRLLRLLPGRMAAVVAAAVLFALAHLPNPVLTPITLLWGLASCALFLRRRNLYTLGLAHAIFGICIAVTVPGPVDHNMRVGAGYYTYRPGVPRHHRIQSDQIVSTRAWVTVEAPTRRSARQARP